MRIVVSPVRLGELQGMAAGGLLCPFVPDDGVLDDFAGTPCPFTQKL